MERLPSGAGNLSGSMHQSGTAGSGFQPIGSGGTGGRGSLLTDPNMQAAAQVVTASAGIFQTVSNLFDSGKKDREREQRILAAENQRHQEEIRKIEEENERVSQNRNQILAARQENYNKANSDLQRRQMEKEKREQELSKRKDQERKDNKEAIQREKELYDQRIRAAEENNKQLMADTKASMEADHHNFLETKQHMQNTHQMEVNMIKGLAGATAYLYKEMGYFNEPQRDNGNTNVRLHEIEAVPTYQQQDNTQVGEAKFEQRPMETSSDQQVPECFKCGSSTKMTLCSHFFCPNCHVSEGNVHCPVCQKIF